MLFSPSAVIKRVTWFVRFLSCFDLYAKLVFIILCSTYKIFRWINFLFLLNFFQSLRPVGKFISFQLYWSTNSIIFAILFGYIQYFHDSILLLQHTENVCYHCFLGLLLLLCFWSNLENLSMIRRSWGLLYEIYRAIRQRNQTQIYSPSMFIELLGIYAKRN